MAVGILHSIFYGTVLQNSAVGAVFVLFILLFRKMTEQLSKGFVRMLWILLLVELLAPPLLHGSVYTLRNLAMNMQIIENSETALGVKPEEKAGALEQQNHSLQKEEDVKDANLQETERQLQPDGEISVGKGLIQRAGTVIPFLWFAGVFCLCVIYLCCFFKLQKKIADAVFLSRDGCWVTGRMDMPFVMPYIRPRIYFQKSLADTVRVDILSHERQHIKNFDPLIKCLAAFAAAVHWFNPLVWVAFVFMGKDLEMYCDERVMRGKSIEERKRYSNTLLEFASRSSGLTAIMHFGESNTEHRIRHILYAKKPHFAAALLLAVIVGASGIFFLTAKKAEGKGDTDASGQGAEALLAEKIQQHSGDPLLKKYFADFDGDGTGEMFAVTEVAADGTSQIWYASLEDVTCLMDDGEGYEVLWQDQECIHTVNSSQKLFVVTCGMDGSALFSKCYYVKSGKVSEVNIGAYLEQLDGEDFAVYPDAYDNVYMDDSWSGHTRKAYYLKWTGNGFEEYTAKEISIDELKKYDDSESILTRIKESGYEITTIYLRSNGILNINVAQDFNSGRNYENVTLKIEDGRVYVVSTDVTKSNLDARDILGVSSYGGIYKESGFYVQEEENGAASGADSSTQEKSLKAGAMIQNDQKGHDYYEELIAVAGECAIKNNGNKPDGYDFSSMLYMEKNWDYGTLGYLIKDIDGNGTDELIFGGNAEESTAWYDGIIYDIYTISDGDLIHVLDG